MSLKRILLFLFITSSSAFLCSKGPHNDICNFSFSGGSRPDEGVLQLEINGTQFYVCKEDEVTKDILKIMRTRFTSCELLNSTDFNVSKSQKAVSISYSKSGMQDLKLYTVCQDNTNPDNCCQPMEFCCTNHPPGDRRISKCRSDWSSASKMCYSYISFPSMGMIVQHKIPPPNTASWTASAFLGVGSTFDSPSAYQWDEEVADCLNHYLMNNTKAVCANGPVKCNSTDEAFQYVATKPATMNSNYCIAVENTSSVIENTSSARFLVKRCDTVLPSFCPQVKKDGKESFGCRTTWAFANGLCFNSVQLSARYILNNKSHSTALSWTTSVFIDVNPHKGGSKWNKAVAGCLNDTLRDDMRTTLCKNGTVKCSGKELKFVNVADVTATISSSYYCIAVNVGVNRFLIKTCDTFLPAFCGSPPTNDPPTCNDYSDVKHRTSTMAPASSTPTGSQEEIGSKGLTAMVVGVIVSAFTILTLGTSCCFYRYLTKQRTVREEQRMNSFTNRTYFRSPRAEEDNTSEYAMIMDTDCPDSSTPDNGCSDSYKPELPAREVTASDVYSEPPDSLVRPPPSAADYLVTYDDPIRDVVKRYNMARAQKPYDVKNLNEKRVESFKRKQFKNIYPNIPDQGDDLVKGDTADSSDKTSNRCSLENQDSETIQRCLQQNDASEDVNQSEDLINNYSEDDRAQDTDAVNEDRDCSAGYFDCISAKRAADDTSSRDGQCLGASENSDYEDTSVYNSTDQFHTIRASSSCDLFKEHVCLHCLTPDHLKKLGIRIVSEDNLYSTYRYTNWPKRFSESDLHSYVNMSDFDVSNVKCASNKSLKTVDISSEKNKDGPTYENRNTSCEEEADVPVGANIHSRHLSTKETACDIKRVHGIARKCSKCNEDMYDTLEHFNKQTWNGISDRNYNKIAEIRYLVPRKYGYRCCRVQSS